MFNVEMLKLHV